MDYIATSFQLRQGYCMIDFNISIDGTDLKLCYDCLAKESGNQERSKDVSTSSVTLSMEIVRMVNPDSFQHSNEKYERSQDVSAPSLSLNTDSGAIINPDSPEQANKKDPGEKKYNMTTLNNICVSQHV